MEDGAQLLPRNCLKGEGADAAHAVSRRGFVCDRLPEAETAAKAVGERTSVRRYRELFPEGAALQAKAAGCSPPMHLTLGHSQNKKS